jgi:hypothetical protein
VTEPQFQRLMDDAFQKFRILPNTTMEQIAVMCAMFSSEAVEVYARVECVNGKPVAYLARKSVGEAVPAFLRRQAS